MTNSIADLQTTRKVNRRVDFMGGLFMQSLTSAKPSKRSQSKQPAAVVATGGKKRATASQTSMKRSPTKVPKKSTKKAAKKATEKIVSKPAPKRATKGGAASRLKATKKAALKSAPRGKTPATGNPPPKSKPKAKTTGTARISTKPKPKRAIAKRVFTAVDAPSLSQGSNLGQAPYKWQFLEAPPHHWRDFDARASVELDAAWSTKDPDRMTVAVPSGDWSYEVDFNLMQQTNVNHPNHRQRAVRRVPT